MGDPREYVGDGTGGDGVTVSVRALPGGGRRPLYREGLRQFGAVDEVTIEDLRRLPAVDGPCVSVFMPTSPYGPGTLSGPGRLGHLLDQAGTLLAQRGMKDAAATALLAPLREFEGRERFGQRQSLGLALFAAPGFAAVYRVPVQVPEGVWAGPRFRLRLLLPLVSGDGSFIILALAQSSVRLFRATRQAVEELGLRDIPESIAEAIPQDVAERNRQAHSAGSAGQPFHGQGFAVDFDRAALERFFRAVDTPLVRRLGTTEEPLVLACVGYYLPIYRSVSRHPHVWEKAVVGNPEHSPVHQLHERAWALVEPYFSDRDARALERFHDLAGTGLTVDDPKEVAQAAAEGRVEELLVAESADGNLDREDVAQQVDRAVGDTLRHGGRVRVVAERAEGVAALAAILRY
jgi:Bacterial archaeo-eukaryotic release factor family 3